MSPLIARPGLPCAYCSDQPSESTGVFAAEQRVGGERAMAAEQSSGLSPLASRPGKRVVLG
jgi:hypothetical protein